MQQKSQPGSGLKTKVKGDKSATRFNLFPDIVQDLRPEAQGSFSKASKLAESSRSVLWLLVDTIAEKLKLVVKRRKVELKSESYLRRVTSREAAKLQARALLIGSAFIKGAKYIASYIFMEHVPGQDLFNLVTSQSLSLSQELQVALAVIRAVDHMHKTERTLHRDLKGPNLMVQELEPGKYKAVIIDWEYSLQCAAGPLEYTNSAKKVVGTKGYLDPSMVKSAKLLNIITWNAATETYALGVTFQKFFANNPWLLQLAKQMQAKEYFVCPRITLSQAATKLDQHIAKVSALLKVKTKLSEFIASFALDLDETINLIMALDKKLYFSCLEPRQQFYGKLALEKIYVIYDPETFKYAIEYQPEAADKFIAVASENELRRKLIALCKFDIDKYGALINLSYRIKFADFNATSQKLLRPTNISCFLYSFQQVLYQAGSDFALDSGPKPLGRRPKNLFKSDIPASRSKGSKLGF